MRLLPLCCISLIVSAGAWAQTFYGSVVGTVNDSSGAAVVQASVTLTNTATADRRAGQTDGAGNYQFVNIPPGQYRVEIERPGFQRLVRYKVTVEVQSAVRIDAALQVGDVNQVIEVNRKCISGPSGGSAESPGDAAERP